MGDGAAVALAWEDEDGAHHVPVVPGRVLVLGRDPACDLVLANLSVSRRHAEVHGADGGAVVRHRSRTSPTWLNGRLIVGEAPLAPGDVLRLGIVELRVVGGRAPGP